MGNEFTFVGLVLAVGMLFGTFLGNVLQGVLANLLTDPAKRWWDKRRLNRKQKQVGKLRREFELVGKIS